jgi:hypothetical protein
VNMFCQSAPRANSKKPIAIEPKTTVIFIADSKR